jgi:hypothetical protein
MSPSVLNLVPSTFVSNASECESCRISRNVEARADSSLKKPDIAADNVQTSLLSAAVDSQFSQLLMNLLNTGWSSAEGIEEAAEGGRFQRVVCRSSRCSSANSGGTPWLEGAVLGKFWTEKEHEFCLGWQKIVNRMNQRLSVVEKQLHAPAGRFATIWRCPTSGPHVNTFAGISPSTLIHLSRSESVVRSMSTC